MDGAPAFELVELEQIIEEYEVELLLAQIGADYIGRHAGHWWG